MVISSPIGDLTLTANDHAITRLDFGATAPATPDAPASPLLQEAARQLAAYFSGTLHDFDLPLEPQGTPFQQKVWQALLDIPYGARATYSDIALAVGNPKGVRAVGMANNRNPLAIFIPCHRVVGKNGSLVGYGGGLPVKESLLALEKESKEG
jgi:methylated-DNA-[protein]-cysteine S-methyltransferase